MKMAAMRFVAAVLSILALLSANGVGAPRISFAVPGVPSLRQGPRAGRAADDSPSVDPAPSQDETKPAPMGSGEVVIAMKKIAAGDHQDREAEPPSRMAEHLMADGGGGGGGVVVGAAAAAAVERGGVETREIKGSDDDDGSYGEGGFIIRLWKALSHHWRPNNHDFDGVCCDCLQF